MRGFVLTGQRQCANAEDVLAVLTEWLALEGEARVFITVRSTGLWCERWRRTL